jgi:hypothetical protein
LKRAEHIYLRWWKEGPTRALHDFCSKLPRRVRASGYRRRGRKESREMIGDGVAGVLITDTQTNRTYEPDKFHLLMGNKPN